MTTVFPALMAFLTNARGVSIPPINSTTMRMFGSAIKSSAFAVKSSPGAATTRAFFEVANGDAHDFEARAEPLRKQVAVGDEVLVNPSANGAKACQAYANGLTHVEPGSIRSARSELPK